MPRSHAYRTHRLVGAAVPVAIAAVALAACAPTSTGPTTEVPQSDGPVELTVWTDPVRQPGFEAYQEAHPDVKLTIEALPDDPTNRISLANQAGSGWPDLIWGSTATIAVAADVPYEFSADISAMLPEDLLEEYTPGTMDNCTGPDGEIFCLQNDFSPLVLWYDRELMDEFGYDVPTTWEEFEEVGLQLAAEHPGYVVGTVGDGGPIYFSGAQCPAYQPIEERVLRSDLADPNCVKVASMLDGLVAAGSMSISTRNDPEFIQQYGAPRKVLMMYGPLHIGKTTFGKSYAWPDGALGIAPPLRWEADDRVFNYSAGGGAYIISKHSEFQQAATDLAVWMATGPYQADPATPTFPAYAPAQADWIANNGGFMTPSSGTLDEVISEAANSLGGDWADAPIPSLNASYGTVMRPALANGATIEETLPVWGEFILNEARAAGWAVVE